MIELFFKFFVSVGSEWVLYLLIFLSVLVLSIALERAFSHRRIQSRGKAFWKLYTEEWIKNGVPATKPAAMEDSYEAEMMALYAKHGSKQHPEGFAHMSNALLTAQQGEMEKRLSLLGTLGNNAPYLGLVGTVIGIIRAFANLAAQSSAGSGALNASLAEALVATAIGIGVALESVAFFNYFTRKTQVQMKRLETLQEVLMGALKNG
jgi:biopolymer transport protein ExbB